jgi:glucokinase
LQKKFGHVSCERVLSGPGIRNIYEFLRDTKKAEEPASLRDQIKSARDASALIAQLASDPNFPICQQTMTLFISILGAESGNCALRYMTTGGIYIGGIIAAKNVDKLKDPAFLQAFLDKGRMGSLLKDMPVKVILNDDCGLIGSARYTLVQKAFGK